MQLTAPDSGKALWGIDRLMRLRPAQAWTLVLLCADIAALSDFQTGSDLWFGPAYLLTICLAAWSLGWRGGQLTGVGCMGMTFALNGLTLYPHGQTDFLWNLALRFVTVSAIIAVIAGARRAYIREWWYARTDILTGALNRQAFFELSSRAVDTHSWRLLVFADLDGLKQINDLKGHAAGDLWLKAYGADVRKMIRRDDIFARVGGDEFLLLLSVKDEESARTVAARLHKAMNNIPVDRGTIKCSVGALIVPPGEARIDDLVRSADNLMYEAKLRGACLQLGTAPDIHQSARGRARKTSRLPSGPFLSVNRSDERRANPRCFAKNEMPV